MQHNQALAFLLIWHSRYRENLLGCLRQFMQLFFNLDVRHHLSANFAEARQAVSDGKKPIFFHRGDVAGHIPAIAQNFGGLIRTPQIALHHVWAFQQQHARFIERQRLESFRINNAHAHAR